MPTEIIDPSHPDFEAERRKGVGASEAAQACNVSEYGSAFELWERKTGRTPPKKQTMAMEIGNALEGLLIDKFCYHLPLYRQHQRLAHAGITLNRGTLTQWVHRTADLLTPIYHALLSSILQSHVLTMDEKMNQYNPGALAPCADLRPARTKIPRSG